MSAFALVVGLMLALMALGMPVSLAIILTGAASFWVLHIPAETLTIRLFNGVMNSFLLAVPLLIVMGHILAESGMADRLVAFANSLVGFMRGGLAMVNVVTGLFLAEMSGVGTADAAILSKVFVPPMQRQGYQRGFAAAVTSAAASLGIMFPPSIPLVLLGLYANMSVTALFEASLLPGLLLTLWELAVCALVARRRAYPIAAAFSLREVGRRLADAWFVLLIPVVVVGTIFSGIATITEAAELGLVLTIVGAMVYGRLSLRTIARLFQHGVRQAAVILLLIASATLISWVFANEQVGQHIVTGLSALHWPRWQLLLLVNAFIFVMGIFLHGAANIIIIGPLLLPFMLSIGVAPLHYGMIFLMGQAVGQQTLGNVLLAVASVTGVPLEEILPDLSYFIAAFIAAWLIVTYLPWMSLTIPHLLGAP